MSAYQARRLRLSAGLCLFGAILVLAGPAHAVDVTASTNIVRSAFLLNRSTSTFDTTVTVTNIGQKLLIGPIKLIVNPSVAGVTLANATGTMPDGKPYIVVPLPTDVLILDKSQLQRVTLKLNNPSRAAFDVAFVVDAYLPPANLPPDPGEAGKATLLGVDSDGDGVRDDVQRYIEFKYPQPNKASIRAALRTLASIDQQEFVSNQDATTAAGLSARTAKALVCLSVLMGINESSMASRSLFAQQMNTTTRYAADSKHFDLLAGQGFILPDANLAACN